MDWKTILAILGAGGAGAITDQLGWTGGESGQTKPQRRQSAAQADIAELMSQMMALRNRMTGPTLENGELTGPVVDALAQAQANMERTQSIPRQRLQARRFNPFARSGAGNYTQGDTVNTPQQLQTFGPSPGRAS
jgi:hypothetical protein